MSNSQNPLKSSTTTAIPAFLGQLIIRVQEGPDLLAMSFPPRPPPGMMPGMPPHPPPGVFGGVPPPMPPHMIGGPPMRPRQPFIARPRGPPPNMPREASGSPPVTVFVGNISERAQDAMVRSVLACCGPLINWKRVQVGIVKFLLPIS